MTTRNANVLVIDNDLSSNETIERILSDYKLTPQLLIGLEGLEPTIRGFDRNVQRIELIPERFPALAFVADTVGGILTSTDEIMRVLQQRKVCCIATTVTKPLTLEHVDFGINRLNFPKWAERWLQPIYVIASKQRPAPIVGEAGKRKVLVIHDNIDFLLSMTNLLSQNKYPAFEPLVKVTRLADDKIVGYNTSMQDVEIELDELAMIFVPAVMTRGEGENEALPRAIVQSARAKGVCCVSTSRSEKLVLSEADFMLHESRNKTFIQLWMQAIYPIACKRAR